MLKKLFWELGKRIGGAVARGVGGFFVYFGEAGAKPCDAGLGWMGSTRALRFTR